MVWNVPLAMASRIFGRSISPTCSIACCVTSRQPYTLTAPASDSRLNIA
jgi:hypothetical protein